MGEATAARRSPSAEPEVRPRVHEDGVVADVVVPVHGGLNHVRRCLRALAQHTQGANVIVLDDGSSPYEARRLRELVDELDGAIRFELLRNEENEGYLRTVNRGIRHGSAPYVVTLNSDTIPTPGWLDGLIAALEADPTHAIACPLSNHANLTRFEFPWGSTYFEVAEAVREHSPRRYPEIGLASGFCLASKRQVLEDLGLFDEAYHPGYFEETDLCMRAMEQGYRVVADDVTFIFHHGWASFGPDQRTELMQRNAAIFEARWGDAHRTWQQRIAREEPFRELEEAVRRAIGAKNSARSAGPRWSIERVRGQGQGPKPHPTFADVTTETGEIVVTRRRPANSLLLLLSAIDSDSSTTALLRLAGELMLSGADVHVATAGPVNIGAFADPVPLRPHVFADVDEMVEGLPAYDLVVATSVDTLLPALALQERDGCEVGTLLGESSGRPLPAGPDVRAWTIASALPRIRHHLARGAALPSSGSGPLARHQVPYGVDLDVFFPASDLPSRPHVVVPVSGRTRLAEWEVLVDALSMVGEQLPDVAVTTYGLSRLPVPEGSRALGHLTLTEEAMLLREASLVIDPASAVPAVRARLRAFAVGIPVISAGGPDPAGITLAGHNSVVYTPGDARELSQAIMDVIKDPLRYSSIIAAALATAHAFDLPREVQAARRAVARVLETGRDDASDAHPRGRATRPGPHDRSFELAKSIVMSRHEVTEELEITKVALEKAQEQLAQVYTSETWRVGNAVLGLPKLLRRLVRRNSDSE